jgi:hypothetical protein
MPVRIDPPEDLERIRERVSASVAGTFGTELTLSTPYRVEAVDLESLAGGELNLSWEARWQCLVGPGEPTAAVDVVRQAGDYVVVSINYGDLAPRFNEAAALADSLLGAGDYELSEIEIPGLHLAVARLIDTVDGSESLIPVLPLSDDGEPIEVMRIYTPEELTAALQPAARRALEAHWE